MSADSPVPAPSPPDAEPSESPALDDSVLEVSTDVVTAVSRSESREAMSDLLGTETMNPAPAPLEPTLPPIEMKTVADIEPVILPRPQPRAPQTTRAAAIRRTLLRTAPPPEPNSPLDKWINQAVAGEPLPDNLTERDYEELIFHLGQFRKERAAAHNYKDGLRINDAIRNVQRALTKKRKDSMQKEAKADYEQTLSSFQEELQEFDNETKRLLTSLQEQQEEQRQQLALIHEGQEKDHHEHWSSPAKYRLYNRASNQLTILRRQHSILLVQCRFGEAEEVNRQIESKIREEEAINHAMHQRDFEESLAYLHEKQKGERDCFEVTVDVQLAQFHRKRATQRKVYENKEKKIEVKGEIAKDSEKLWNLAQMQRLEDLSGMQAIRVSNSTLPSLKMSQRDIKDSNMIILSLPPLYVKPKREKKVKESTEVYE
jgi:hypothetical protein